MSEIKLIQGGVSVDWRGQLSHVNDLDMSEIARFYIIYQKDPSVIRAWNAHRIEKKWFYVIRGSFTAAFVKIDNWEHPSPELKPEVFRLTAENSQVLCIPGGYANGFKANEPDSELLVYSNEILSAAGNDNWRYDSKMWMDWSKY